MIFIIDESLGIESEVNLAVDKAAAGDMIIAPTVPAYNKVMLLLRERRPDTLIYVRLGTFSYFPKISSDATQETDDMAAMFSAPTDGGKSPS